MITLSKHESGFSVIEAFLILIIVALVGGVSFVVYKDNHKINTAAAITTTATTSTVQTNPYAGWKTFCDSNFNYCFKYPADWTLTNYSGNYVTVVNPAKSVYVSYDDPFEGDGQAVTYYTYGVYDIATSDTGLKVISGYQVNNTGLIYPEDDIFNTSQLQSPNQFVAGKESQSALPSVFSPENNKNAFVQFTANPIDTSKATAQVPLPGKGFATTDQAKSWFTSNDGKTSLLIMRSFYVK